MSTKAISGLVAFGLLSAVLVFSQAFSSEEVESKQKTITKLEELKEEVHEEVKVVSKPKIIATDAEKNLVSIILSRVKNGQLKDISRAEIKELISYYQKSDNLASAYADIISLYQSGISPASKIFLLSLLGDVATAESAQTLMVLLDSETSSDTHVSYESRKAIANLVYDNSQGKVNTEVSEALTQYWETSDNETFKSDIQDAIFKIGNTESVETIVDTLNDSSTSTQEANSIAHAMTGLRSEEATEMLVAKYNNGANSVEFNNAYINALPLISNETAINALYERSSTLDSSSVEEVIASFTTVQQRNPNAEEIIKERLYENKLEFASDEVKTSIESVFKTDTQKKI